jgi:hypothetical protein
MVVAWREEEVENRKITIQLLPLIIIIINIFSLLKLPSNYTIFSQKQHTSCKILHFVAFIMPNWDIGNMRFLFDGHRYVILGDGWQMEGISNEAASLAGHWGLGKLIAFYDDNHISIDGNTDIAFTEDVLARYEALGWHTILVKNGNTGYDDIRAAIKKAKAVKDKPTLIKVPVNLVEIIP